MLDVPYEFYSDAQIENLMKCIYDTFDMISVAKFKTYEYKPEKTINIHNGGVKRYRYDFQANGYNKYVTDLFRYPLSTLSIHVFKTEDPAIYVSKNIELEVSKLSTYNKIETDLFEHLKKHDLICRNPEFSFAYKDVYEFTPKYYKFFPLITSTKMTPRYLSKLILLFDRTSIDVKKVIKYKETYAKLQKVELGESYSLRHLTQANGFMSKMKKKSSFIENYDYQSEFYNKDFTQDEEDQEEFDDYNDYKEKA